VVEAIEKLDADVIAIVATRSIGWVLQALAGDASGGTGPEDSPRVAARARASKPRCGRAAVAQARGGNA
jgi:hypothetical protein